MIFDVMVSWEGKRWNLVINHGHFYISMMTRAHCKQPWPFQRQWINPNMDGYHRLQYCHNKSTSVNKTNSLTFWGFAWTIWAQGLWSTSGGQVEEVSTSVWSQKYCCKLQWGISRNLSIHTNKLGKLHETRVQIDSPTSNRDSRKVEETTL
jgi:hypothetical protein